MFDIPETHMVTVPLTEAPARQQDSLLVPNFSSEALCETMVEVLGVETFASGADDARVGLVRYLCFRNFEGVWLLEELRHTRALTTKAQGF